MNKTSKEKGKNKKSLIILIVAIVILIIVAFLVFGLDIFDKKSNTSKEDKKEQQQQETDYAKKYTGVYTYDNTEIYLYPIATNKLFYTIDGHGYYEGSATVNEEQATDGKFVFKTSGDGIELIIKNNTTDLKGGTYSKIDDYTREDFYKYNIGPIEYVTSEYTARFKNEDIEMNLVQISDTEVEVEIHKGSLLNYNGTTNIFIIQSNGSLLAEPLGDSSNQDRIEFDKTKAVYIAAGKENKEFAGTYSKEKELTIEEIIKNKYSNY